MRQTPPQHDLPNYRPYSQAPAQIKQLLQLQQAREPLVSIPAHAPAQLAPGQAHQGGHVQSQDQAVSYRPTIHVGAAPSQKIEPRPQGQHQQHQPAFRPQQQAYAPQGHQQYAPQQQQAYAPQPQAYRPQQPIYNHQQQQQPHYSKNIPPEIQQLIHAQQNQQGIMIFKID